MHECPATPQFCLEFLLRSTLKSVASVWVPVASLPLHANLANRLSMRRGFSVSFTPCSMYKLVSPHSQACQSVGNNPLAMLT